MLKTCFYFVTTLFCLIFFMGTVAENPQIMPSEYSYVYLDGKKTKVYFNDGDTFKVLKGKYKNKRARITGFNTLENYGPVHLWQKTSPDYLYDISNKATHHARNDTWHCESVGGKDTYGRLLVTCDDLALSLIEEGLAHAYSIDKNPAKESYVKKQKKAQNKKMGMWKYHVPDYIITSLHSTHEINLEREHGSYNRMISTEDGSTEEWFHHDYYETCEKICNAEESCMIYVPYLKRYGAKRASCLD